MRSLKFIWRPMFYDHFVFVYFSCSYDDDRAFVFLELLDSDLNSVGVLGDAEDFISGVDHLGSLADDSWEFGLLELIAEDSVFTWNDDDFSGHGAVCR